MQTQLTHTQLSLSTEQPSTRFIRQWAAWPPISIAWQLMLHSHTIPSHMVAIRPPPPRPPPLTATKHLTTTRDHQLISQLYPYCTIPTHNMPSKFSRYTTWQQAVSQTPNSTLVTTTVKLAFVRRKNYSKEADLHCEYQSIHTHPAQLELVWWGEWPFEPCYYDQHTSLTVLSTISLHRNIQKKETLVPPA